MKREIFVWIVILIEFLVLCCTSTSLLEQSKSSSEVFSFEQLIVCSVDGRVHSINPTTGAIRWSLDLPVSDSLFSSSSSSTSETKTPANTNPNLPSLVPSVDGGLYAYIPPIGGENTQQSPQQQEEHIGMFHAPLLRRLPISVPDIVSRAPFTGPDGILYLGDRQSVIFNIDGIRGTVKGVITSNINQLNSNKNSIGGNNKALPGEFRLGRVEYSVHALDPLSSDELWNVTLVNFIELQKRTIAWTEDSSQTTKEGANKNIGDINSEVLSLLLSSPDGGIALVKRRNKENKEDENEILWTTKLQSPAIAAYMLKSTDMKLERIHLSYGEMQSNGIVTPAEGVLIASHKGQLFAIPSLQEQLQYSKASAHSPQFIGNLITAPLLLPPSSSISKPEKNKSDEKVVKFVVETSLSTIISAISFLFGIVGIIISWFIAKKRYLKKGSINQQSQNQEVLKQENNKSTANETASAVSPLPPLPPIPTSNSEKVEANMESTTKKEKAEKGHEDSPAASKTSPILTAVASPSGKKSVCVGKMEVFTGNVLGRGSVGTIVFEGKLDGRRIAVKRLLKEFYSIAQREVSLLLESDEHPNLVRYYATEEDSDFVYLALTLCSCSLSDWVEKRFANFQSNHFEASVSAEVIHLMQDLTAGIAHIHSLNIVHRDLKPQNILLDMNGRARISDMGLAKKFEGNQFSYSIGNAGSAGWMTPETLGLRNLKSGEQQQQKQQQQTMTKAIDIFALGCVFHYMVTGQHPFGERLERDSNIVSGNSDLSSLWTQPELFDLIEGMIQNNPSERLSIEQVQNHPFFWDPNRKLQFMLAASDRLEVEKANAKIVVDFESRVAVQARLQKWDKKLDVVLLDDLTHHRKYNFDAARDLLRVLRNKANHYYDLPINVRKLLGPLPDGFMSYFSSRYPSLIVFTYRYLFSTCPNEPMFSSFFPKFTL